MNAPDTHLRGLVRVAVQAGWLLLVGPLLAMFALGVPVRFRYLQTLAGAGGLPQFAGVPPALEAVYTLRLGPAEAAALHALGLSLRFYAAYVVAFEAGLALVCAVVALFIFWRRSDDWMTLWASLFLVLLATNGASPELGALAVVWSGWGLITLNLVFNGATALGMVSHVHLLFLSPDGRAAPRRTLGLAAAFAGLVLALWLYSGLFAERWGVLASAFVQSAAPVWLVLIPVGVASQIYRYRRVSGPLQRQQTKWLAVGLVAFTLGFVENIFFLYAASQQSGLPRLLLNLARPPLVNLAFLLLPICLGFSILRYRLWDIDLIIRRTLIYSGLTAALALVYLGSVVLLQALFQALTGQRQSEFVTVVSTLAIAVLFFPFRRRLQALIDRLFYRSRYDAAKTLAAFGATLRDETDLEILAERSINVVHETMHPAHVSLWLKQNEKLTRQ